MKEVKKIFHTLTIAQGKSILNGIFHMLRLRQQQYSLCGAYINQISHMRPSLRMQLLRNTVFKSWLRIFRRLKGIIPRFGCWEQFHNSAQSD